MKNLALFLVFFLVAFLSFATMAQPSPWIPQQAIGLPNSVNPVVRFSAVDDNVCWGINNSNNQYLRTTNGGDNWTVSTITGATGLLGSCISAIDVNVALATMYDTSNATSGGVFKTTDGGQTWAKQTAIFQGAGGNPVDIHFFDSNNGIVIGTPHSGNWEIYRTTNGGTQWTQVTNIPPPAANEFTGAGLYASVGNNIWFGTFAGGNSVYRSTDRGITWSVVQNVPGHVTYSLAFKDSLNGLTCNCFEGLGNRISRTTDGGATWTAIQNVPTTPSTYFITYVPGTQGSYVITSTSNIGFPETTIPGSAYSNDDGSTWNYINNLPYGPASFSSWNTGWSGGVNDVVYKWESDVLPVELTSFTAQAQNQTVILNWVTATELNNNGFEIQRKVLESDFATVGFVKGEGTTTNQKEYSYVDRNLTDGKYFYRLKQLDFNGAYEYSNTIEVDVRLLDNFTLEQNYPNPFNPTTTIGYVLQEKSSTKLILMNAIGEEIAVLVNEEQDKGYHRADLDGKNLSSGIYFYKLQAGNFVETKKMILLK